MAFLDGHKKTASGRTNLARCFQRQLDRDPVSGEFGDAAGDGKHGAKGGRPAELNIVVGGDRTGGFVQVLVVHQGDGCGPISVAIQQCANDPPVHHAGEGLVVLVG